MDLYFDPGASPVRRQVENDVRAGTEPEGRGVRSTGRRGRRGGESRRSVGASASRASAGTTARWAMWVAQPSRTLATRLPGPSLRPETPPRTRLCRWTQGSRHPVDDARGGGGPPTRSSTAATDAGAVTSSSSAPRRPAVLGQSWPRPGPSTTPRRARPARAPETTISPNISQVSLRYSQLCSSAAKVQATRIVSHSSRRARGAGRRDRTVNHDHRQEQDQPDDADLRQQRQHEVVADLVDPRGGYLEGSGSDPEQRVLMDHAKARPPYCRWLRLPRMRSPCPTAVAPGQPAAEAGPRRSGRRDRRR